MEGRRNEILTIKGVVPDQGVQPTRGRLLFGSTSSRVWVGSRKREWREHPKRPWRQHLALNPSIKGVRVPGSGNIDSAPTCAPALDAAVVQHGAREIIPARNFHRCTVLP